MSQLLFWRLDCFVGWLVCMAMLMFSCRNDSYVFSDDTWSGGVPKSMVIKTLDDSIKYKIEFDSLMRILSLETIKGKKKNGSQVYFFPFSSFTVGAIRNEKDGETDGHFYELYPDLQVAFHGRKLDGMRHGVFVRYYQNGKIKYRGNYIHGYKDGEWMQYYEDGTLKSRKEYLEDLPYGEWRYYYENGRLKARGSYGFGGQKNDDWEYWDEKGNPVAEEEVDLD